MNSYDTLLDKGIRAAEAGSYNKALLLLKRAAEQIDSPTVRSYSAYCWASSRGKLTAAARICQDNAVSERHNPVHYLLLGRIFLLGGQRQKAIKIFRQGLKFSPDPLIINELKLLGIRRSPVITALDRSHPINRLLGRARSFLG